MDGWKIKRKKAEVLPLLQIMQFIQNPPESDWE